MNLYILFSIGIDLITKSSFYAATQCLKGQVLFCNFATYVFLSALLKTTNLPVSNINKGAEQLYILFNQ